MKIDIIKVKDKVYQADCRDCPGTPPVGYGETEVEALAALFYILYFSSDHYWLSYIKKEEPIIINDKMWHDPWKE